LGLILIFSPTSFTQKHWVNEVGDGEKNEKEGQSGVDGEKLVKSRSQNEVGTGESKAKHQGLRKNRNQPLRKVLKNKQQARKDRMVWNDPCHARKKGGASFAQGL
jgi:hypothetical protein